jgi:creatinine amidohydrolase
MQALSQEEERFFMGSFHGETPRPMNRRTMDRLTGLMQGTLANLNWVELQALVTENALVLIPIGVIEEHGPHLCLGTDIYTAHIHCLQIQEKLAARGQRVAIAPPFYWGVCQSTGSFLGSFRIRKETAQAVLFDLISSLAGFGFKNIFGVNAHGDIEQNIAILEAFKAASAASKVNARYAFAQNLLHHYGLSGAKAYICPVAPQAISVSTSAYADVHAGDIETATLQHFYPELVDVPTARTLPPLALGNDKIMAWLLGGHTQELSAQGYLGAPADFEGVEVLKNIDDIAGRVSEAILQTLK